MFKISRMINAIITEDIIHSTKLDATYRTILFERIAHSLKQWDKKFNMRSETFRGDSFHCLINKPEIALRIVLIQKTFIRSLNPRELYNVSNQNKPKNQKKVILPNWILDARIAIGIGNVDYISNRLVSSGGEAFQLSGQLLDTLYHFASASSLRQGKITLTLICKHN